MIMIMIMTIADITIPDSSERRRPSLHVTPPAGRANDGQSKIEGLGVQVQGKLECMVGNWVIG
jgi:hypothetical protein